MIAADWLGRVNTIRPYISQIECVCVCVCVCVPADVCTPGAFQMCWRETAAPQTNFFFFFPVTCCSSECETRSQLFGPRSLLSLGRGRRLLDSRPHQNKPVLSSRNFFFFFYASPVVHLIVGWIFYAQYRIPLKVIFSIFCRPKLGFCVRAPRKRWYFCLCSPFSADEN